MIGRCALLGCVLLLVAPAAHASTHPFPRFGAGCVRDDFTSAETHVRAERCGPTSGRAVVVLHGCGGFSTFDHQLAADLPSFGIATLYVDFFAPTPPPGTRGYCGGGGGRFGFDPFPAWQQVTVDAARLLRRQHYAHVGAVGWSLGAGVALATAEERHVFDAVAAFSAIASPPTLAGAASLPPTIFLDGGAHDIVPAENARALYAAAHAAHVPAELYIYGNGTHNWAGKQGEAGRARAAAFLRRHLG